VLAEPPLQIRVARKSPGQNGAPSQDHPPQAIASAASTVINRNMRRANLVAATSASPVRRSAQCGPVHFQPPLAAAASASITKTLKRKVKRRCTRFPPIAGSRSRDLSYAAIRCQWVERLIGWHARAQLSRGAGAERLGSAASRRPGRGGGRVPLPRLGSDCREATGCFVARGVPALRPCRLGVAREAPATSSLKRNRGGYTQ
jgi:hypothetical protein